MRAYKLVIFDFDGTLADSFGWFVKTIHAVAHRYRFKPVDIERMDELRGYSGRQLIAHLGISWWKLPLVAREMRRQMHKQVGEVKTFAEVEQLLLDLHHAGIGIAIVTSNSQENVEAILGSENMALIRTLSCRASLYGKRTRFRSVLEQCHCAPGDALCVGDEIRDAEAAAASNIDFLGVAWGYTKPIQLQKYTQLKICEHIDEILAVATGAA